MSSLQTICTIEPATAKVVSGGKPVATLILGSLLLLIRP
jgi:hypothetical protein